MLIANISWVLFTLCSVTDFKRLLIIRVHITKGYIHANYANSFSLRFQLIKSFFFVVFHVTFSASVVLKRGTDFSVNAQMKRYVRRHNKMFVVC